LFGEVRDIMAVEGDMQIP